MRGKRTNEMAKALKREVERAAFHEAGHAVARIYVGAEPTDTEIDITGAGISHGTETLWTTPGQGQYALWDLLIVLLAGSFAEARFSNEDPLNVLPRSGKRDLREANRLLKQLAGNRFAVSIQAGRSRAHEETNIFLSYSWPDIEKVAAVLLKRGQISAKRLVKISQTRSIYDATTTLPIQLLGFASASQP